MRVRYLRHIDLCRIEEIEASSEFPWSRDAICGYVSNPMNIGICVVDDDRGETIVGYALYANRHGYIDLNRLIVHPDYRGRGFGRALVEDLKGRVSQSRYKRQSIFATLFCRYSDEIQFISKCGFVEFMRHEDGLIEFAWRLPVGAHPEMLVADIPVD